MAMGNQKVPETLISIAALLFLMVAHMALSQTTHFQVKKFVADPPNELTYQGDAFVPTGSSFLRLTRAEMDRVGRLMYSKPFQFWSPGKQVEFETTIKFKITPTDDNPGEGIVFFIAPPGSTIPPSSSGGNFGIFSSSGTGNNIFAVEIDTFPDKWDPTYRHIGIDFSSHTSSSTTPLDDSVLEKEVTLSIKYDKSSTTITVDAKVGLTKHYVASYDYDLSTLLTPEVQVGISASTGRSVSLHDIYSWDFTASMISNSLDGAGIRQVVST